MKRVWRWCVARLRYLARMLPVENGHPLREDITELAGAYRVWAACLFAAGGATLDVTKANTIQGAEYLARSVLESHLSKVCSGAHTGVPELVRQQLKTVFANFADEVLEAYDKRVKDDFELRHRAN